MIFILEKINLGYNEYKETPNPNVVGVSDSHQILDLGSLLKALER